jgi:carnitine-CoA ligase
LSEEDVKAFIVFTTGGAAPLVEIREFVAGRLARFKVPRYLEVVDGLPHTATGRVAKHRLPRDRTETEEDFEARQPGETAWPAEY